MIVNTKMSTVLLTTIEQDGNMTIMAGPKKPNGSVRWGTVDPSIKVPLFCLYPPPLDWLGKVPRARYYSAWTTYLFFAWWAHLLIFFALTIGPSTWWGWDGDWPYHWYNFIILYVMIGIHFAGRVFEQLPYHFMAGLDDIASWKMQAIVMWPWWYLKLWLTFLTSSIV